MASLIEIISPRWAANRAQARLRLERARYVENRLQKLQGRRGFDAASSGRRLIDWAATDTGPAGALPFTLEALRNRSRDLRRNNPFFRRAVNAIAANTVGTGIQARILEDNVRPLRPSSRRPSAAEVWLEWAETTACDADGRLNFYGLQTLAMKTLVESGEVLIRRRWRRPDEGFPVPVQLQILEPDLLADKLLAIGPRSSAAKIRGGIEFDRRGRRVAYHLLKEHPKLQEPTIAGAESVRVAAEDVIHLYRVDRPGQIRGVPWAAPVMTRLRHLDDFEDAALERAKVAACFAAFVIEPDTMGLPDASADPADDPLERLEPGMIETLTPGRDVKFGAPPSNSDYPEFVRAQLRAIASGLDMPYEILGDLSQVNFSSARMGWIEFQRQIDAWRWEILIPTFCQGAFDWWAAAAETARGVRVGGVQWTAPRREMVDPAKEVAATKDAIRCGLLSWAEAVREQGYEPDQVLAEIAEYNQKADELGITLDTDPRQLSQAGQTQADPAPPSSSSSEEEPDAEAAQ